ncbi:MAG: hypothetical protein EBS54_08830, partial [Betaproteobacteria bacterium]|nr:hypothetical protein [Betaproteobacteria bacterium]
MGTDKDRFALNAQSGTLGFLSAPNYEADARRYSVEIVATDKAGAVAKLAVLITLTDVNEAPSISSASAGAVAENAPPSTVV